MSGSVACKPPLSGVVGFGQYNSVACSVAAGCRSIMAYDDNRIGTGEQFDGALEGARSQFTDRTAPAVVAELREAAAPR